MSKVKILIVEDEILIADHLSKHLTKNDYEVVGIAISYEEAIEIYRHRQPDLVLLDIRLYGKKSGVDVANFIRQQEDPAPFIFLTSQMDQRNIENAKRVFPAGYLSKPIQIGSVLATVEITLHNYRSKSELTAPSISLFDGSSRHRVLLSEIQYLKSEHVYVKVFLGTEKYILQRGSLKELMEKLPPRQFVQTHRSYVVNIAHVTHWEQSKIYLGEIEIPVSRSRKEVLDDVISI